MGLKEYIGGVGLTILFVISMIYFMTSFIQRNNPDGFGSELAGLNNSVVEFSEKAQALQDLGVDIKSKLEAETPSETFLFLIIISAFTIPMSFIAFLVSGIFLIFETLFTSLGFVGDGAYYIVFVVINGLMMVGIILAILKAVRLGQTER